MDAFTSFMNGLGLEEYVNLLYGFGANDVDLFLQSSSEELSEMVASVDWKNPFHRIKFTQGVTSAKDASARYEGAKPRVSDNLPLYVYHF